MKALSVVGARPQFIKAAVISRKIRETPAIDEVIVHSGQHFDPEMSEIFFQELNIPPPLYSLNIHGGNHGRMTGRMMQALETVMEAERPDVVIVYGDTNTTLAAALVASKLAVPIAHIEAGLRSYNRIMPEEINRVVTDHLSTLLFCPTKASVANLRKEGIVNGVHHVGDVMFDAALYAEDVTKSYPGSPGELQLEDKNYGLCTVHRAENTDDKEALERLVDFLNLQAQDLTLLLPLHPRTRSALRRHGLELKNIKLIDPVGYFELQTLLMGATVVFTDSGGIQKEAYFHGVPCVTLRHETEWVETIECGWNRLWTVEKYITPRRAIADYGAGNSAQQIVSLILGMA